MRTVEPAKADCWNTAGRTARTTATAAAWLRRRRSRRAL